MFRIGARAAVVASAMFVGFAMSAPAIADFKHQFPGKGNVKDWQESQRLQDKAFAAEDSSDSKSAEQFYRAAIHAYPYDAVLHYDLGLFLDKQKRYREAEPFLRKSVELQPVFENWDEFGKSLGYQGKLMDAERAFQHAQPLAPTEKLRAGLKEQLDWIRQQNSKSGK